MYKKGKKERSNFKYLNIKQEDASQIGKIYKELTLKEKEEIEK